MAARRRVRATVGRLFLVRLNDSDVFNWRRAEGLANSGLRRLACVPDCGLESTTKGTKNTKRQKK
jgi:hypothetical protein